MRGQSSTSYCLARGSPINQMRTRSKVTKKAAGPLTDEPISKITELIWLGGADAVHHVERHGIGGVLNMTRTPDPPLPDGVVYKQVPLDDSWDEDLRMPESLRFVNDCVREGIPVLVHCRMGVSRSAAIVLAYMVQEDPDRDLDDHLENMRILRPGVDPNAGFCAQLERFQENLRH